MKIEFTKNPTSTEIDFLTNAINAETPTFGEMSPFAFLIRDENGEIIAGCNGYTIYGSIHTDQLWVHPDHRKSGLGKQLMQQVIEYGIQERCIKATLCTMNFQNALGFYQKLGYVIDFEESGYTNDSKCIFLSRKLENKND